MHNKWDFPICQIVGYKNSGKTTLMQNITRYLSTQGLQVGTLKHHGHGGEPELNEETDSYKHLQSGAAISAVKGEKRFQVMVNHATTDELDGLIQFYTLLPLDILLIEGFKQAEFPKIVLIRDEEDLQLLQKLTNILAIGAKEASLLSGLKHYTFEMDGPDNYLPELFEYIKVRLEGFKKGIG